MVRTTFFQDVDTSSILVGATNSREVKWLRYFLVTECGASSTLVTTASRNGFSIPQTEKERKLKKWGYGD